MTTNNKARILTAFSQLFPFAKGELLYTKDYELLIAVVLSAQATDKAVNIVTRKLFIDYPTWSALTAVSEEAFLDYFRSLGLFRNKARHVHALIKILETKYNGTIPQSKKALMSLPGVGVKTANVIRAELFKIPEIAVDTHVARIAKRLGFAGFNDNVNEIERKLRRRLRKDEYIKTHHQMIHFGRYFCKAQNPSCRRCPLVDICLEQNKNL